MTSDDRIDDLASAHLDDATSAEEDAEIAADPVVQARIRHLQGVRAALRMAPPAEPERREAAIRAAVAAFTDGDVRPDRPAAGLTSLATAIRRRGGMPLSLRVLGAAAAVALVAALVPLLGRLGGSNDSDTASRADTTFRETGGDVGADAGTTPEAADAAGVPTTTIAPPIAFDTVDALVASVRDATNPLGLGPGEVAPSSDGSGPGCAEQRQAAAAGAQAVATSTATLAGEPVVVLVVTAPDGTRTVRILRIEGCSVLAERSL
jgi:hypothetical protein